MFEVVVADLAGSALGALRPQLFSHPLRPGINFKSRSSLVWALLKFAFSQGHHYYLSVGLELVTFGEGLLVVFSLLTLFWVESSQNAR